MAYFSGLSDALRLTFVQIMILSAIAVVIFLYGMIGNFQKWGGRSDRLRSRTSNRKERKRDQVLKNLVGTGQSRISSPWKAHFRGSHP